MSKEIVIEREGDERRLTFAPISITALPTPSAHPCWQLTPISVTQLKNHCRGERKRKMDENKSVCSCVPLVIFMKVRGGLAITTTTGPEMSYRNVSGGSVRIYRGPAKSEREKECEH